MLRALLRVWCPPPAERLQGRRGRLPRAEDRTDWWHRGGEVGREPDAGRAAARWSWTPTCWPARSLEPGTPGLAAVVAEFGDGVLQPDGSLDRAALGALVFPDPERLAVLNGITHPRIARADRRALRAGARRGCPRCWCTTWRCSWRTASPPAYDRRRRRGRPARAPARAARDVPGHGPGRRPGAHHPSGDAGAAAGGGRRGARQQRLARGPGAAGRRGCGNACVRESADRSRRYGARVRRRLKSGLRSSAAEPPPRG